MKKCVSLILSITLLFNTCTNNFAYGFSGNFLADAYNIFKKNILFNEYDELVLERAISAEYDLPNYADFLEVKKSTAVLKNFLFSGFISVTELLMLILTSNQKVNINFARVLIRFEAEKRRREYLKRTKYGIEVL